MREFSGYAKIWGYWRDAAGQVHDANFNFLGRVMRGQHTLACFEWGKAFKQDDGTYWTMPFWVTVHDDAVLVDNVKFDAINHEFQAGRDISVYVEYMSNHHRPYPTSNPQGNQDSRTFGVGKRVVFDVAGWLQLGTG